MDVEIMAIMDVAINYGHYERSVPKPSECETRPYESGRGITELKDMTSQSGSILIELKEMTSQSGIVVTELKYMTFQSGIL